MHINTCVSTYMRINIWASCTGSTVITFMYGINTYFFSFFY